MSDNEAGNHAYTDYGTSDTPSPQWREYQSGGITVRVPAEPPKLTPQAARALFELIRELSDRRRHQRPSRYGAPAEVSETGRSTADDDSSESQADAILGPE